VSYREYEFAGTVLPVGEVILSISKLEFCGLDNINKFSLSLVCFIILKG
jgi:hypothetical protein